LRVRLRPGDLIGPFEIVALVGQGGMGEVYRASDTRLHRDVALKTLPAGIANSDVRRARFEREALAISQLNHPNICAIYDIGVHDGVSYFVMEYVDGESLAHRLRRGPLEWPVAVKWAIQIATALDAAHRRGITHRDVKPANVMVSGDLVKLLDFGLAKHGTTDDELPSADATVTLTAERTVVGTLHYMSPEQLEGRDIDSRTDVFAFGTVLYEMLTARKAFAGDSGTAVTTAILASQPASLSSLIKGIPPGLDRVVQRALAKQPDERWQTARDLINELEWIRDRRSPDTLDRFIPSRRRTFVVLGAAAAVIASILVARPFLQRRAFSEGDIVRLSYVRPPGLELTNTGRPVLAIVPDGRTIVFNANNQLYARRLDAENAVPLPGTQGTGVTTPFFSPDGQWVAFFSFQTNELNKVPVGGGAAVTIFRGFQGAEGNNFGASWTPGGDVLFATREGVFRVPATGGTAHQIIAAREGEAMYGPHLLPDGDHVLLTVTASSGPDRWEQAQIVAHSLSSGLHTTLVERERTPD
jgi:eukaryotic-like serine/threonine-protein kinase